MGIEGSSLFAANGARSNRALTSLTSALLPVVLSLSLSVFPLLVCEKRRPALLQSFFQSLVLAPIFTFFELLFWIGLKQELARKVQKRVLANIKQFREGVPPEKQTF